MFTDLWGFVYHDIEMYATSVKCLTDFLYNLYRISTENVVYLSRTGPARDSCKIREGEAL